MLREQVLKGATIGLHSHSTMGLQLDVSPVSLRSCSPSVLLDERMKSQCPSERITERRSSCRSSPASSCFAAEIKQNTRPDFTGWNKKSSKWVKYEKVTVFSSPMRRLSAPPLSRSQTGWGLMGADEDSLVWAREREKDKGKQDGTSWVGRLDWLQWASTVPQRRI